MKSCRRAAGALRLSSIKMKRKVHTVKWYENIDDIADRYGVSVEAIMEANSLKDRKLKSRQKLQIPSSDEAGELSRQHKERAIVQIEETQPGESEALEEDVPEDKDEDRSKLYGYWKTETDITLMLPLKADGKTSSRNIMDFYSGVLTAVRDLGNEGIDIKKIALFNVAQVVAHLLAWGVVAPVLDILI